MGEKVETKNEGEKKAGAADAGEKKAEVPSTVVLKLDLHCEGCAKKVRRSISHLEGVEKVKAECDAKKLTVMGNVDPIWLREKVESKTKKKVELISPQPKKDGGGGGPPAAGGDKKAVEEKSEKKTEEKAADDSKKPKEAVVSTVVMKIKLHCDGCANKIKRVILKNIDGVSSVTTNLQKDTVTVIGTMEANELASFLKEKLKRSIEIVPPKKDNEGTGDKKAKEGGDGGAGTGEKKDKQGGESGGAEKKEGGGDKKESETKATGDKKESESKAATTGEGSKGGSGEGTKVEVNKLEHHIYNPDTYYTMPMYNQAYVNQDYGAPMYHHEGYSNTGYAMQYAHQGPPPPPPTYLHTSNDGMFSDENPNGCYVM